DDDVTRTQAPERGGPARALRARGRLSTRVPLRVRDDGESQTRDDEPTVQLRLDDVGVAETLLRETRADRASLTGQRAEHEVIALTLELTRPFEERARRRR